jgi:hypothetical protein
MGWRLRRKCRRFVDQLDLPRPFSIEAFCRQLELQRHRQIRLLPIPRSIALSGTCGLWLATVDTDFIFYEEETTPLHRTHIIAHEIAHLLCDSQTKDVMDLGNLSQLMPSLDPALIQRSLRRADYTTHHEEEAEMIASLIIDHATRANAAMDLNDLDRLKEMLGTQLYRPS